MQPLEVSHLSRIFSSAKRDFIAVNNVSFNVPAGQVTCLVGINGAGKTTLLKMCASLLEPTSGSITVHGVNALKKPFEARKHLGVAFGGDKGFYPRVTVFNNLLFFADLAGVPRKTSPAEVSRVLKAVDLSSHADKKAGVLSRGQIQRLHIARALLGSPSVLILDEPTSGLDPDISLHIRSLIASIAQNGTAVFLASHSLEEVAELSEHVLLLKEGHIVARGTVPQIVEKAGLSRVTMLHIPPHAKPDISKLRATVPGLGHAAVRPIGSKWCLTAYWSIPNHEGLLAELASQGITAVDNVTDKNPELEDAYILLSHDAKTGAA